LIPLSRLTAFPEPKRMVTSPDKHAGVGFKIYPVKQKIVNNNTSLCEMKAAGGWWWRSR
jgi:hypothetical protein